jgi:hypothetical protein
MMVVRWGRKERNAFTHVASSSALRGRACDGSGVSLGTRDAREVRQRVGEHEDGRLSQKSTG